MRMRKHQWQIQFVLDGKKEHNWLVTLNLLKFWAQPPKSSYSTTDPRIFLPGQTKVRNPLGITEIVKSDSPLTVFVGEKVSAHIRIWPGSWADPGSFCCAQSQIFSKPAAHATHASAKGFWWWWVQAATVTQIFLFSSQNRQHNYLKPKFSYTEGELYHFLGCIVSL